MHNGMCEHMYLRMKVYGSICTLVRRYAGKYVRTYEFMQQHLYVLRSYARAYVCTYKGTPGAYVRTCQGIYKHVKASVKV